MSTNVKKYITAGSIIIAVMLIDQVIKIWVKTHFFIHEAYRITDWFYILFTENRGMAFGMELFDKYFLTGFRLVAVAFLLCYLVKCIRQGEKWGYLVCLSLVIAGAAGNIIDCVFYGQIFNAPMPPETATFVPFGEGYEVLFRGRVVDMFYFPLFSWNWPSWMPFVGGENFIFFSPIFNFADSAISCGVVAILIFYHKKFQNSTAIE